jgi:sulfate adenylyltransferase subunit 1
MATGASNADALVLLVDVNKGLLPQTRRHLAIARLLGIKQVVVFVNKMDTAGFDRAAFLSLGKEVSFENAMLIPGSALNGDMVVERGANLGWYRGPTLLEHLETLQAEAEAAATGPFRFPVQLVSRPQGDGSSFTPRGYMGRIEAGHILAGAEVALFPGGRRTRVRQILAGGQSREIAVAGDSVTLVLAEDIDLSRGDLIADAARPPREERALEATLVWLGSEPLRPGGRYIAQQSARRTLARVTVDGEVKLNDIARARLALHAPLFVDAYESVRATGALILIDEATNQTVAAGLVA